MRRLASNHGTDNSPNAEMTGASRAGYSETETKNRFLVLGMGNTLLCDAAKIKGDSSDVIPVTIIGRGICVCNWCSYAGADKAGGERLSCPAP